MDAVETDESVFLRNLNIILLTPVIVLGLIGNCLSMLTWSRGCHRDTSTASLLTALAVADTIVLTIPALERWFHRVINYLIRSDHIVTCKMWAFLSYYGPTVSSWIIVMVTAERFVSIWFPVKVRVYCTRKKVTLAMIIMNIIVAAVYLPLMLNAKLYNRPIEAGENESNVTSYMVWCDAPENETFHEVYLPAYMWIDMGLLFVIPFILIVIGNCLIMYKIFKSRTIFIKEGRYISYRTRIANSFTIRAIALSITFLVCLLPVTSLEVISTNTGYKVPEFAYDIIHILLYANSAFNFILYCAIGSGFRKDLKAVLSNLCRRKKVHLDHLNSNMNHTHARHTLVSKQNSV